MFYDNDDAKAFGAFGALCGGKVFFLEGFSKGQRVRRPERFVVLNKLNEELEEGQQEN